MEAIRQYSCQRKTAWNCGTLGHIVAQWDWDDYVPSEIICSVSFILFQIRKNSLHSQEYLIHINNVISKLRNDIHKIDSNNNSTKNMIIDSNCRILRKHSCFYVTAIMGWRKYLNISVDIIWQPVTEDKTSTYACATSSSDILSSILVKLTQITTVQWTWL